MTSPRDPSLHPSFLELDRHALGVARADVASHVAGCESCQARLAHSGPASEVPAWARQLAPRRRSWFSWPVLGRTRALAFAATALACAALVWTTGASHFGRLLGSGATQDYVGTKGGPVLWLYVKRGDRVALWNGADPVMAGDLLQLKVQPDRFTHVNVFGASKTAGAYTTLYDAPIASGQPTALAFSFRVDAESGDEALLVVLGPESISPAEVAAVLARDKGRYWSRHFVLPKAGGSPR
jgi:hypothetical protein